MSRNAKSQTRKTQPKENEARLRETVKDLKAMLRSATKDNRRLQEELGNLTKPVRIRRPHLEAKKHSEMSPEEWRKNFITRYKPKSQAYTELVATPKLTRVVLESPFAPRPNVPAGDTIEKTVAYARACVRDCLRRGEAPIASHLLYTQPGILDDTKPAERKLGMAAGFAWGIWAERVVVYTDLGVSSGMETGILIANEAGITVEYRKLYE